MRMFAMLMLMLMLILVRVLMLMLMLMRVPVALFAMMVNVVFLPMFVIVFVLIRGMDRPFMNSELHAFDFLPLLAIEVKVEVAQGKL